MRTQPAKVHENSSLYDRDPYTWALEQSRALRERRTAALDWENLAEEVEDVAGRHEDALQSNYEVILEHLLKHAFALEPDRRRNSRLWQMHARNARLRVSELLERKPGLKRVNDQLFAKAWPYARNAALGGLSLADKNIPGLCPWSLDQVGDDSFWPVLRRPPRLSHRRGERR